MNELNDSQLIRAYVEQRSEPAFAELVRRHVDLVYSAALRMVCDSHRAQDVTQGVFIALAANAAKLMDRPVLAGWLHRTTQNLAASTVRTEVRRQAREQEVATMNEMLSAGPDATWQNISPHLDAALEELADTDRDALLLRYFERQSAREVGQTLGITEDAAQKRVSRAVERLREVFAKQGITATAAALVVIISANGIQAAPIGLAATISATTVTWTAIAATTTATKAIAMTAAQKIIITATVAVLAATGIYEARQTSRLQIQVQELQHQLSSYIDQIQISHQARDDALRRLEELRDENRQLAQKAGDAASLQAEVDQWRSAAQVSKQPLQDPIEVAAKSWLAKVDILKKWVEQHSEQQTPEFPYLLDYDWLDAVKTSNMLGDYAPANAIGHLHEAAKNQFAHQVRFALSRFVEEHNGNLPNNFSELNAYMNPPMTDSLLNSYELLHAGRISDLPKKEWLVREIATPSDDRNTRKMMIRTDDYMLVIPERVAPQ